MKKIISLFLSLVICVAVFGGCKKQTNDINDIKTNLKWSYDSTYADYGEDSKSAYENICKTVYVYGDSLKMDLYLIDSSIQLFYTSNPLSVLVKEININENKDGLDFVYKYDKDKHSKFISDFEEKIKSIVDECSKGSESKTAYALNVYKYVASSIVVSEDMSVSTFNAIMNNKGTSFTYASMFEYLLAQKDIPVYHIIANDASGAGWGLSAAKLDGKLYYFDVMSEYYANKGELLLFFGMTSDEVNDEGLSNLLYTTRQEADLADDTRFDVCRHCTAWEIKDNNLLVTNDGGEIVQISL
jgi:hypothetical protein